MQAITGPGMFALNVSGCTLHLLLSWKHYRTPENLPCCLTSSSGKVAEKRGLGIPASPCFDTETLWMSPTHPTCSGSRGHGQQTGQWTNLERLVQRSRVVGSPNQIIAKDRPGANMHASQFGCSCGPARLCRGAASRLECMMRGRLTSHLLVCCLISTHSHALLTSSMQLSDNSRPEPALVVLPDAV